MGYFSGGLHFGPWEFSVVLLFHLLSHSLSKIYMFLQDLPWFLKKPCMVLTNLIHALKCFIYCSLVTYFYMYGFAFLMWIQWFYFHYELMVLNHDYYRSTISSRIWKFQKWQLHPTLSTAIHPFLPPPNIYNKVDCNIHTIASNIHFSFYEKPSPLSPAASQSQHQFWWHFQK